MSQQQHRITRLDSISIPRSFGMESFVVGCCRISNGGLLFGRSSISGNTEGTMIQIRDEGLLESSNLERNFGKNSCFLFLKECVITGQEDSRIEVNNVRSGKREILFNIIPSKRKVTALERFEDDKFFYGTTKAANFIGMCDLSNRTVMQLLSTERDSEYTKEVTSIKKGQYNSDKVVVACRIKRKERTRPYYRRRRHYGIYVYRLVTGADGRSLKGMKYWRSKLISTIRSGYNECKTSYAKIEVFPKHGEEYIFVCLQIGGVYILDFDCKIVKAVQYHKYVQIRDYPPTIFRFNHTMFISGITNHSSHTYNLRTNEFYTHESEKDLLNVRTMCQTDRNRFFLFKASPSEPNWSIVSRCELWKIENSTWESNTSMDLRDRIKFLEETYTFKIVFGDENNAINAWALKLLLSDETLMFFGDKCK